MDDKMKTLLLGVKINRKKIYIERGVIDKLKEIKRENQGSLDICEMVECCFDNFDFSMPQQIDPDNSDIMETFSRKDESVQLLIRDDIYDKLKDMKKASGRTVHDIISLIVQLTLN